MCNTFTNKVFVKKSSIRLSKLQINNLWIGVFYGFIYKLSSHDYNVRNGIDRKYYACNSQLQMTTSGDIHARTSLMYCSEQQTTNEFETIITTVM